MAVAGAAPASAAPVTVTEHFAYSGVQESWIVPQGVTSITVTVAAASGYDRPGSDIETPRSGGAGGVVTVQLAVTPGSELLLLAGQHPLEQFNADIPSGPGRPVVGNRPSNVGHFPGGGGSFLATVADGILVAAGGGGGGSRSWAVDVINAEGGAGGFATGVPDGQHGGPGTQGAPAASAGRGATIAGPGVNGVGQYPEFLYPAATEAAHVADGVIVPGYGGTAVVNTGGGGGGGYFGGGAGDGVFSGTKTSGSGGGGSGYLAAGLTALSTGTNIGNGYITIEHEGIPPTISGPALASATVGDPFVYAPTLSGTPDPTVTLTGGVLPQGLTLHPATGEISGVPQDAAGDYPVTLTADNGAAPVATLEVTIGLGVGEVTAITVSASANTATQGGSIELHATGFDAAGNPIGIPAGEMEYRSSVPTDVVEGNRVTFPTASPHVITGLHLPTGVSGTVTVTVQVAPVPPNPDPAPTPPPTKPQPVLEVAGSEGTAAPWISGVLLIVGAEVLAAAKLRRGAGRGAAG